MESTIKNFLLWPAFEPIHLTVNMRAIEDTRTLLLKMGNGSLDSLNNDGRISIPDTMILKADDDLIDNVFGQNIETFTTDCYSERAILFPTNEKCRIINNKINDKFTHVSKTFYSVESINSDDSTEISNFPVEFLNTVHILGLPPHELTIKIDSIVMLIRNLKTKVQIFFV